MGHARTFWIAAQRAVERKGTLILRNEDLDPQRCRREFARAMIEDLDWLGIRWQEGPDCGGPCAPYSQSERREHYLDVWRKLRDGGFIYACTCSRKELALAATAPHDTDDEPIYPGWCRSGRNDVQGEKPAGVNWRFRVHDQQVVAFSDLCAAGQRFIAGQDFGDFVVWRRDDVPAYQLAAVADDAAMRISEVVRGADLLKSTARQILLYRALGWNPPEFYHCPLLRDRAGMRLSKRQDALSIRHLREQGWTAGEVLQAAAGDSFLGCE